MGMVTPNGLAPKKHGDPMPTTIDEETLQDNIVSPGFNSRLAEYYCQSGGITAMIKYALANISFRVQFIHTGGVSYGSNEPT